MGSALQCTVLTLAVLVAPYSWARQFIFNPEPVAATTADLQDWRIRMNAHVARFLTRPDSAFGRTLAQKGALSAEARRELTDFMECRPARDMTAVICLTFNNSTMNEAFVRLSLFADGGAGLTAGRIVTPGNQFFHSTLELAVGHNVSLQAARRFFAVAAAERVDLLANERALRDLILSRVSDPRTQILSVSLQSHTLTVLSHELDHALFATVPEYRQEIIYFWLSRLGQRERQLVRRVLRDVGYDQTDERVVIDEFQAYLLQLNAESGFLDFMVPKYQAALLKRLERRGVNPAFADCVSILGR